MTKRIDDFIVVNKKFLNEIHFILELKGPEPLPEIKPGQFVQVRIENGRNTFLRRPFSIHDIDRGNNTIKLLIRIIGEGTRALAGVAENQSLNLIYPLGNGFSLPSANEKVLMIGGGCGIAPLLCLGKHLNNNGFRPDILLGFRNSQSVMELDEYKNTGSVYISTEDGSAGEKGLITQHPVLDKLSGYNRVYCCGPEPMMKSVAGKAEIAGVTCEVSLEHLMACGFGVCLCCVVKTSTGNKCTCTDGPVFKINDLQW